MQLVTFKSSYIVMKYDELIQYHHKKYLKKIEKLISALMKWEEPISWWNKIYNKIFKLKIPPVDKSWVRILERSLITDYTFGEMKHYQITRSMFDTCLKYGSFYYDVNDIIWYQNVIKKLINEKNGIIRSEFGHVQVDQDEIKRLGLHK